jgi:predicted HicB family RNase H-like nuclease
MKSSMNYKGYLARIEFDDEDGIFVGRLAGIRDGIGFHADSVDELRAAFHSAVEDYLETCAQIGKEPQKAYSGQMMFRVNPEVHRKAALAAELAGKSLNQWAEEVLGKAAGT